MAEMMELPCAVTNNCESDHVEAPNETKLSVKNAQSLEDIVLFGSKVFFALEEDGFVEIEIIRVGPAHGDCTVCVSTQDVAGSAKGDTHYVKLKDMVVTFDKGERVKIARVHIEDNNTWDGLQLIGLTLHLPRGSLGVKLGTVSRAVAIISESDRYPDGLPKSCAPPTKWQLVRAFAMERAHSRGWKLFRTSVALSYQAVHSVIDSIILKLVIDLALGGKSCNKTTDDDEESNAQSIILGVCYLVAFGLAQAADRWQLDFRGRSGSRKWFRERLLRKYLLLSDTGIKGFSDGEFLNTMTYRVEEVVDAWYNILLFFQACIQIIAEASFQVWVLFGKIPSIFLFILFGILLPAIVGTLWCRERRMLELIQDRQNAEDLWVQTATEVVVARKLVLACGAVERVSAQFRRVYDDFYKKHRMSRFYQQSSLWIPKWCAAIVLAFFYTQTVKIVEKYKLTAADIMVIVKSWMSLRNGIENAFKSFVIIQRSIVGIEKVSFVFNREDKVGELLGSLRTQSLGTLMTPRNRISFTALSELDFIEFHNVSFVYPVSLAITGNGALDFRLFKTHELQDLGEIETIQDEGFLDLQHCISTAFFEEDDNATLADFNSKGDILANHTWILKGVSAHIPCDQGGIVLLQAASTSDSGRRTVLRLLSNNLLPTVGALYMAPHRKYVMVDRSPTFLEDTILRNLRLGRCQAWETGDGTDASTTHPMDLPRDALVPDCSELLEICRNTGRACGLRECYLLDLGARIGGPGLERLSMHDAVAMSLARTFLAEPDTIFIDHLGDSLGPDFLINTMWPLLRKYVEGGLRGLLQPPITCRLPLPPTLKPIVFWSSSLQPANMLPKGDMIVTLTDKRLEIIKPMVGQDLVAWTSRCKFSVLKNLRENCSEE